VYARIAFEAASDHIRNAIFKKNTTRQQLKDAGWIGKHEIRLGSLNIMGGTGGTIEDEVDTIRLNIECKVDHSRRRAPCARTPCSSRAFATRFSPAGTQMKISLQMRDERVVAHMD